MHIPCCPDKESLKKLPELEELKIYPKYGLPTYYPPKLRSLCAPAYYVQWSAGDPVYSLKELSICIVDSLAGIVQQFPNLQILHLQAQHVRHVTRLGELRDLRALYCHSRDLTDYDVEHIAANTKLQYVEGSRKYTNPYTLPAVVQFP